MRSTNYCRVSRAAFCSVLLLSQHALVEGNSWATGRRSSRSSTLAVAAPGGRDRPVRDWKAISRNASKQLEEKKSKANEKVEEAVEAIEPAHAEAKEDAVQTADAAAEALELEEGTPQSLAIMLSKVAVIATVGVYGAKKVVTYAKAFIKARKDSAAEGTTEDGSAVVASGDAGEGGEEQAEAEAGDGEEGEVSTSIDTEGGDDDTEDQDESR